MSALIASYASSATDHLGPQRRRSAANRVPAPHEEATTRSRCAPASSRARPRTRRCKPPLGGKRSTRAPLSGRAVASLYARGATSRAQPGTGFR
eukprot:5473637-Pyramimonas_sp.AAC.1